MNGIGLRTFLSFDKMIAPTVIKVAYWIGLGLIALGTLVSFLGSFAVMGYSAAAGLGQMVLSLVGFAVGILFWRIIMEIYMVFFSIHDRLTEIRDNLVPGSTPPASDPLSGQP